MVVFLVCCLCLGDIVDLFELMCVVDFMYLGGIMLEICVWLFLFI